MKSSLIVVGSIALIASGLVIWKLRQPAAATIAPASATESSSASEPASPSETAGHSKPLASASDTPVSQPAQSKLPKAVRPSETAPDETTRLRETIAQLLAAETPYPQKRALWEAVRREGKIDQVIAELESGVTNHPSSAAYPTTLGQAYLQKLQLSSDTRDHAILAMKADQNFDAALKLDENYWEAGFIKAVSLSYWPDMLNKRPEVIERFTRLITQQESAQSQPQFAQSYIYLGEQYAKDGQRDNAEQVWKRGAAFFPGDEGLKKKLGQ